MGAEWALEFFQYFLCYVPHNIKKKGGGGDLDQSRNSMEHEMGSDSRVTRTDK